MAAFEVIALDTATPQLRAPGASDTYTFPRAVEMPLGTANGVLYLNGSKVVTSGSGLTFDGGNLGLGVTPSAWGDMLALQLGNYGSGLATWKTNRNTYITSNAYFGSDFRYATTGPASYYNVSGEDGAHRWYNAPPGTAGNAISFTQALTLDVNRNLALNTTSVGTSAVGALSIGSGTEPSSGPADTVQLYSVDRSAGNTIPAFYCEGTGVTNAGITNTTVTHKIAMKINGTVYYLLATTNAT